MELIDADELRDIYLSVPNGVYTTGHIITAIDECKTIDAVPLEPLCEWLAGYADPPKYAMKIIPESGKCLINARAKAWEHHFKNMMECGLMEDGKHDHG